MSTSPSVRLPLPEAAEHAGVHISTLRRRIHRGELPAVSIGNRHFVSLADLDNPSQPAPVPVAPKQVRTAAFDELEAAARRVAASAPPLSADQRARLASLLGGA